MNRNLDPLLFYHTKNRSSINRIQKFNNKFFMEITIQINISSNLRSLICCRMLCVFIKNLKSSALFDFDLFISKKKKNLVWHSYNFLLPYIAVEEYFIICFTFTFNLYFQWFVVDELPAFIITVNNFWT